MIFSSQSFSAISVSPYVKGYNGQYFKSSLSLKEFVTLSSPNRFKTSAKINIAGSTLSVPAKMSLPATIGSTIKTALRLNPTVLVGTLAAGYLIDQGIQYLDGVWIRDSFLPDTQAYFIYHCGDVLERTGFTDPNWKWIAIESGGRLSTGSMSYHCFYSRNGVKYNQQHIWIRHAMRDMESIPATTEDWEDFSDPTDTVLPELPDVDYFPEGSPVEPPVFEPDDLPIGAPYTQPDGSTWQPFVKLTPSDEEGKVVLDTYEKKLSSSTGETLPDSAPVDTPEELDICQKYPNSLQCSDLDEQEEDDLDTQERDFNSISPVDLGGASGSCPAPISMVTSHGTFEFSTEPLCQMGNFLKPLILLLAWISAALIFIGGVKQNG